VPHVAVVSADVAALCLELLLLLLQLLLQVAEFLFAFISILPFAAAVACQLLLLLPCVATFSIQLYFMFMLHRFTL